MHAGGGGGGRGTRTTSPMLSMGQGRPRRVLNGGR